MAAPTRGQHKKGDRIRRSRETDAVAKKAGLEDWKMRLLSRMDETGHNMKSLSLTAGLGETAVRDMLKRTSSPNLEPISKVAKIIGLSVSELLEGPTEKVKLLEVLGEIGSSTATWFQLDTPIQIGIDERGRTYSIETSNDEFAIISGNDLLVFERTTDFVKSRTAGEKLLLLKSGRRYCGVISQDRKTGEYIVHEGGRETRIPLAEVEWFAAWKRTYRQTR